MVARLSSLDLRDLVLLDSDHVKKPVDLRLLLFLEFLMQLAETGSSLVVWICGVQHQRPPPLPWAVAVAPIRLLQLARRRDGRVVDAEVVHQARSPPFQACGVSCGACTAWRTMESGVDCSSSLQGRQRRRSW